MPPLSDRELLLISHRHQDVLIHVSDGLERRIGALWDQLGGVTDEALDRFSHAAADLVARTQRWAISDAESYIRTYVQRATGLLVDPTRVDVAQLAAGLRAGVAPAEVYARPTITARKALADGKPFADAMRIARIRATSTAQTDLALASRAGNHAAMQLQSRVVGYRRVPNRAACPFCLTASTQRYHARHLMPLHGRCHCSVAPIIGTKDPGHIIDHETLSRLKAANSPVEIAVHEHGELGPVLGAKGDHFTGPAEIAA